ncbi:MULTISPECIES: hypothetical protein [Pedobacter]|uniref:cAMP-binding domain of CRP or a regulatory subunit of cAMP-dependent protein kinases n=1 Tax=Pedobacter suwonensis TaxID=332999 RepID=A0A1I0TTG9_9SPHI|nr:MULTISPECIES: hypothetical protein [Pedobacter]SFA55028.1 cAMP-binding domain of CRP or a regulatory subunit of cAMP-dependent protein kinases [Pedobacter suwonensis]
MNFTTFCKHLEGYGHVSSALKAYLRIALKDHKLKNNELLDGNLRNSFPIIFVRRGLLKTELESKLDPGKKMLRFHFEGSIVPNLIEKNFNDFKLETSGLDDTTIMVISKGHTQNLFKLFPEFNQLITNLLDEVILEHFHQTFDTHHLKGEERLEYLLRKHPDIFQLAPVNDIAAFIGMHANTLSGLKNKS